MRDHRTIDLHAGDGTEPVLLRHDFGRFDANSQNGLAEHFDTKRARAAALGTRFRASDAAVFALVAVNDRRADPLMQHLKRQGLGITGTGPVVDALDPATTRWSMANLCGWLGSLVRGLSSDDAGRPRQTCS